MVHNIPHTKQSKKKISDKMKIRMSNLLERERISKKLIGHKISEETRKKLSEAKMKNPVKFWLGKHLSKEDKRNKRIARIKYIQNKINNGEPIYPSIGKNETKILNQIEELSNYKIIRQYYIKKLGYWVDGYIPELNLVIEVDEEYHKNRKERDMKRQKEIEKELKCKFIRIKDKERHL